MAMNSKNMTVASSVVLLLTTVLLTSASSATSQAQPQSSQPPSNLHIEDSNKIIDQIESQLTYSQLKDYTLFENGTAVYEIQLLSALGAAMANKTLEIHTEHIFTPQYGYVYNATGIYTSDGEQFVISTFFED